MIVIYENIEEIEAQTVNFEEVPTQSTGILTKYMLEFLGRYNKSLEMKANENQSTIKVSEVLGKLARVYERIRTTVEYKGEHVLRRNAIERILKRLIWEQESIKSDIDPEKVTESLLKELIWARYLPNNKIPKDNTSKLQEVIEKYLYLIRNMDNRPQGLTEARVRSWIWGVASSEIEDLLDPSNRDMFIRLMYDWFNTHFNWQNDELPVHEKEIQIYLAIHRAFTKSDEPIMRYHLLLREFPNWINAKKGDINQLILKFPRVYSEIESHLNFSGRYLLYRKMQRQVAAFEVFREIARQEKDQLRNLLEDKDKFEETIIRVCENKYKQIKQKVNTGIVRSIIYIFITKVLLALALEVPYEIIRFEDVRYLPLTVNIMVPPMLMWVIGLTIGIPGAKNTTLIIDKLKTVAYKKDKITKFNFSTSQTSRKSSLVKIFGFIYSLIFVLVFGGLSYLLIKINFTLLGILLFFMFLSLVILFAFRIRYNATELKVESDDEGFLSALFNYLTLPFLNFGAYLSRGLSKLNFLTILLDFLIEAPLKSMIELFEEWTSFMREKKEEMVEIPE